jgi:hypothetical protein
VVEVKYSLIELFATGFVDTDGKFTAGVNNTSGNLSPVSICRRCHLYCWKIATIVVDTRSKFVASVVDTRGAP